MGEGTKQRSGHIAWLIAFLIAFYGKQHRHWEERAPHHTASGFFGGISACDTPTVAADTEKRSSSVLLFFGPRTPGERKKGSLRVEIHTKLTKLTS